MRGFFRYYISGKRVLFGNPRLFRLESSLFDVMNELDGEVKAHHGDEGITH